MSTRGKGWPGFIWGSLGLALVLPLSSCAPSPATHPTPTLTVSAAADLIPAFEELAARFREETGITVRFNFGSSGLLYHQILQGAPVDLFASANREYIEKLGDKGFVLAGSVRLYARGRLALWTRADSPLHVESLQDLARPEVRRIALANPEHAPYGVAARQALQAAGLWEALRPKLILGENVRQALQYAETGNADVAIVALSLSIGSKGGRWTLIPEGLHRPLDQALAVLRRSSYTEEAQAFADFIVGPQGRTIMEEYGFRLPTPAPAPEDRDQNRDQARPGGKGGVLTDEEKGER